LLFFAARENIDESAVFGPDIFTAAARPLSFDASSSFPLKLLLLLLACLFGLKFGFNEEEEETTNSATNSKANFASFVLVRSFRKNCHQRRASSFPPDPPDRARERAAAGAFSNREARETFSSESTRRALFGSETTVPSVLR